jgi:hypothetical protein
VSIVETQDEIFMRVVGNLVADPILHDDGKGSKVCICKIASNPPARRWNPRTNEPIPDKERNKTRSIMQLKFTKTGEAEEFAEKYRAGDRVIIEGNAISKEVPKMCFSHKENRLIPCIVDVDGDGKNIEHVMESRLSVTVSLCLPVYIKSENRNSRSASA